MFTFLMIVSGVLLTLGFVALIIGVDGSLESLFAGILLCGLAVALFVNVAETDQNKNHNYAYRDLRSEGWKISTHDVHWATNKVTIGCADLGMHKISGKYQVTVDRPAYLGGGYKIVNPSTQSKIERVCPQ